MSKILFSLILFTMLITQVLSNDNYSVKQVGSSVFMFNKKDGRCWALKKLKEKLIFQPVIYIDEKGFTELLPCNTNEASKKQFEIYFKRKQKQKELVFEALTQSRKTKPQKGKTSK